MSRKKWNSNGWSLIKHSEFHLRLKEILERAFEEEQTEKVRRNFKRAGDGSMGNKKLIFEYSKHQKLWKAMPEYIKKVAEMNTKRVPMAYIVEGAKRMAIYELFPHEKYIANDCYACQYTKEYNELYSSYEVREQDCAYCPLQQDGCHYYRALETLRSDKINMKLVERFCNLIANIPVKDGVEYE